MCSVGKYKIIGSGILEIIAYHLTILHGRDTLILWSQQQNLTRDFQMQSFKHNVFPHNNNYFAPKTDYIGMLHQKHRVHYSHPSMPQIIFDVQIYFLDIL